MREKKLVTTREYKGVKLSRVQIGGQARPIYLHAVIGWEVFFT